MSDPVDIYMYLYTLCWLFISGTTFAYFSHTEGFEERPYLENILSTLVLTSILSIFLIVGVVYVIVLTEGRADGWSLLPPEEEE